MKGVHGKPFIDLKNLLPLDLLDIEEIEIGLSVVNRPANVFGPANPRDFTLYSQPPKNASARLREFYQQHATTGGLQFYTKLACRVYSPGYSVKLSVCEQYDPIMVDDETKWHPVNKEIFPSVFKFIEESEVFASLGRINFFIQEHMCPIPIHNDYPHALSGPKVGYHAPAEKEFLWLNPRMIKNFYVLDDVTGVKHEIATPAAWFNGLDLHGGDPINSMTWSLRIDGKFSSKFKHKLDELYGA